MIDERKKAKQNERQRELSSSSAVVTPSGGQQIPEDDTTTNEEWWLCFNKRGFNAAVANMNKPYNKEEMFKMKKQLKTANKKIEDLQVQYDNQKWETQHYKEMAVKAPQDAEQALQKCRQQEIKTRTIVGRVLQLRDALESMQRGC